MSEEIVHECEDCGHAYTGRYGTWYFNLIDEAKWLCWPCFDLRMGRKKR